MSSESETPYDVVMYPGRAYHEPHPDRLSTMGALYGMQPALAARCRVFELGCGFGGHLMPMAYQYPESHFVGIDLSSRSIAHGQHIAAELGLKNLELRHANVMDISPADGEFDYILAHGVYAWVPDPVREKMMSIFKQNLAPQGVVYVSYNAHPGSHLRNLVRDMMNFHVRNTADPELRVKQARAIMNFFADAVANDTVHGSIVRAERDRIRKMADEVLFHDDLDLGSRAFLLHEVVGAAQKHGLQYLCDATLHRRELIYYPDKVKMIFENFTDEEFMERDQYHDFVDGHGFRRTLLCHDDVKLDRKVDASAMQRFYFASQLAPVSKSFQLTMPGSADFKPPTGNTLTTDHLLSKAAILCLAERWPAAVGFAQVMEEASKLAASVGAPPSEYDIVTLAGTLLRAVSCGHMDLHFTPPPLATTISERPVASAVARQQAAHKMPLTNLRQRTIVLDDEIGRQFLMLVDGTRTTDQLVFDLADRVEKAGLAQKDKPITRGDVEHQLRGLVRLAMIIG